jgi:cellulose synthase/poly-beta-1,6-N-acetylglucosamine synthase-like glycosyltransferase
MLVFELILQSAAYLLCAFLLFNCAYLLFFSLAGHKKIKGLQELGAQDKFRRFCILIPAYQENVVILESAKAALQHAYRGKFDVVVIADGLEPQTVQSLKRQGASVVEVSFEKSTKGKALAATVNALPPHLYDAAIVLDVDNIMGKNFLEEVNKAFAAGYKVVQAHRTAKNTDTAFSLLDACNEEINNHIFRKGHFALGMSASLIGSGMAFQYDYFQQLLVGIGDTVGEDKEIDYRVLKDQVKICYLEEVYVYDEKIENAQVFTRQRTRWLATQVEFVKKYTAEGVVQLFRNGNVEFFDKVLQSIILPRVLLAGVLGACFLMSLVMPFGPPTLFCAALLAMYTAAMFIALPARLYNRQLGTALLRLPYAFICMCGALLKINRTKSSFLPTPHKANAVSSDLDN